MALLQKTQSHPYRVTLLSLYAMKILFNDPNRLFGSEPGAVEKVNAALTMVGAAKGFKIKNKAVYNASVEIHVGPDKWQTYIHIVIPTGRIVAYFYNRQFINSFDEPVDTIPFFRF